MRLCSDILRRALLGKLFKQRQSDNALVEAVLSLGLRERVPTSILASREGARPPCCSIGEAGGVCLRCCLRFLQLPRCRPSEPQRVRHETRVKVVCGTRTKRSPIVARVHGYRSDAPVRRFQRSAVSFRPAVLHLRTTMTKLGQRRCPSSSLLHHLRLAGPRPGSNR